LGTKHNIARRVRAVLRFARHTLAPTPNDYERRKRELHEQLRREVTEARLVAAVERVRG
jgi:hypothetical protein